MLLATQVNAQSSTALKPARGGGTLTTAPPAPPPPDPQDTLRTPVAKPKRPAADPDSATPAGPSGANASPNAHPADAARPQAPETPAAKALSSELLVASMDIAEADQQRAWLGSQGAQLLRRRTLRNLGWVLSTYRLAAGASSAEVTRSLAAQWPDARPEINARYPALMDLAAGSPLEYSRASIGWPDGCDTPAQIALLDGAVDVKLPAFAGRDLHVDMLTPIGTTPDYQHGTALAALLLGPRSPTGLLPRARLRIGSIMAEEDGQAYTTTEWVLRGLDWVLGLTPAPAALNLSFGGPRSAQVERALQKVLPRMRVVAAAGNDGRREPSYPAAYPGVLGVTAIDARVRLWPRANRGEHVTLAAPGVDVWTLDAAGQGYYASGTSFAALFVTAALAATPSAKDETAWIESHTRDLGTPGKDPEFGYGALQMRSCQ